MAWTEITRPKYQRDGLRYASDTTDEEWALIEPHLPPPACCGRTRETTAFAGGCCTKPSAKTWAALAELGASRHARIPREAQAGGSSRNALG